MLKNDYLSKIIEQISEVITTVLELKGKSSFIDADESIKEALKQYFGLNPKSVDTLGSSTLINLVTGGDKSNNIKALLLGQLIKEQGDLYIEEGHETSAINSYIKAVSIMAEIIVRDPELKDEKYINEINEILDKVSEYHLDTDTSLLIARYYEEIGNYSDAEDMIYEVLEENNYHKAIVDRAIEFYNRLLNLDDDILEQGNLPKNEVEDGLEGLLESIN